MAKSRSRKLADLLSNSNEQLDSASIASGSVDTAELADDAVTAAKIEDSAVGADALNVSGNGTSGQALLSDGDGTFSWGDAGGGGGSIDLTADGALTAGDAVVINSDGEATVVGPVETPITFGTEGEYIGSSNRPLHQKAVYCPDLNKIVVVYCNTSASNYLYYVVGSISGSTVTWGTPAQIIGQDGEEDLDVAYDPNQQKVILVYRFDSGSYKIVRSLVGDLNEDDTIDWSSSFTNIETKGKYAKIAYDENAQKVVIVYRNDNSGGDAVARVGTVNQNNTVSWGSKYTVDTNSSIVHDLVYDENAQKVVVFIRSNSSYAAVGTVSGTTISFGTATTYDNSSVQPQFPQAVYDNVNNKVIFVYNNWGSGNDLTYVVGTVSGTSITFGTPAEFSQNNFSEISIGFQQDNGLVVVVGRNGTTSKGIAFKGTPSGNTISFDSGTQFYSSSPYHCELVYDSTADKMVLLYDNTTAGKASVLGVTENGVSLTSDNFIGFASEDYADGATATINAIGSVDTNQTGLTVGEKYYVQSDNTLATTPGNPSVYAGLATSATDILVKSGSDASNVANTADGVDILGTGALRLPNGTDSQRPSSASSGDIRYNTDDYVPEFYDGSEWGAIAFNGFAATAAGAISKSDPVIVKSDGTVAKAGTVTVSDTDDIPADSFDASSGVIEAVSDSSTLHYMALALNPKDSSTGVVTYKKAGASDYRHVRTFALSASGTTFGTEVSLGASITRTSIAWNPAGTHFVIGTQSGNNTKLWLGAVSGTTITLTAQTDITQTQVRHQKSILPGTADDEWYMLGYNWTDSTLEIRRLTRSGTTVTSDAITSLSTSGSMLEWEMYKWQNETDKVLVTYKKSGSSYPHYKSAELSGSSWTVGSEGSSMSNNAWSASGDVDMAFHPTRDELFVLSGGSDLRLRRYSVSGTTISYIDGTAENSLELDTSSNTANVFIDFQKDGEDDELICHFTNYTADTYIVIADCPDGADLSKETRVYIQDLTDFDDAGAAHMAVGTEGKVAIAYDSDNTWRYRRVRYVQIGYSKDVTNVTSDNFVGFAKSAASDGDTAHVLTAGSVSEGQSGLTPGKKYKVSDTGTLVTTGSGPEAGTAISTTKILVK